MSQDPSLPDPDAQERGASGVSVDWAGLLEAASAVSQRAYVPYSNYRVGAAALVDDGRIVVGCNVENAGYGVTLCAECGMISELIAGGGGRLLAGLCVNGDGELIMPCGRCRQLVWEHGGADCAWRTPEGILPMSAVLPQAFGAHNLS